MSASCFQSAADQYITVLSCKYIKMCTGIFPVRTDAVTSGYMPVSADRFITCKVIRYSSCVKADCLIMPVNLLFGKLFIKPWLKEGMPRIYNQSTCILIQSMNWTDGTADSLIHTCFCYTGIQTCMIICIPMNNASGRFMYNKQEGTAVNQL